MADSPQQLGFPTDFVWGAATASYQIEGAANEAGKGPSIWDVFSHTPGKIQNGDNGDVACDHYHRWEEDVELMQEIGLDAYRFSISWPRILPDGRGRVNGAGLDFYDRLVDRLLSAGIKPYITLYHWDLPLALQQNGGWANRDTAQAFADYAEIVAKRLGDRTTAWITHNEPWVAAFVGNLMGRHAPGFRDLDTALRVMHNLLLSHGQAVPRLRAASPRAKVGITLNLHIHTPASDSDEDKAATLRDDVFDNRIFLDPLTRGKYPDEAREFLGEHWPPIQPGDMEIIGVPLDFLGVNYYRRHVIQNAPGQGLLQTQQVYPPAEYTTKHWEVYPQGLYELLKRLHAEYPYPAYYITENGAAFIDKVETGGAIHDAQRTSYLQRHFEAAARAVAEGVPLQGYFIWSLMDNFEWADGYSQRFGIVYIDYPTEKRLMKDSALWYRDFLRSRGR